MKERTAEGLGRLCRGTAALVGETLGSRWRGVPLPPSPPAAVSGVTADPAALPSIRAVALEIAGCTKCPLSLTRSSTVPGEGDETADLMFVGEGPGAEEDRQGRPFVGRAGQLLDRIIAAMTLRRDQVFIANVVKCRPPGNRDPEAGEIAACLPYLHRQMDLIRPRVIVALGKFSAQALLESKAPISRLRGTFHDYRGMRLMPTFHPAYLLRNPADKGRAWEDMQQVMAALGLANKETSQ